MKPMKGLFPFGNWLMRLSVLLIAYVWFFPAFATPNTSSIDFYLAIAFCLFSVLLFIGGFLSKPALTLWSALVLMGVAGYHAYLTFDSKPGPGFALFVLLTSMMILLLSLGNKR